MELRVIVVDRFECHIVGSNKLMSSLNDYFSFIRQSDRGVTFDGIASRVEIDHGFMRVSGSGFRGKLLAKKMNKILSSKEILIDFDKLSLAGFYLHPETIPLVYEGITDDEVEDLLNEAKEELINMFGEEIVNEPLCSHS